MSKYLLHIIEGGENQHLDFKFEINDARKIARTLVAFANSEGGKLLIGVKDNGKIAGIRSEEEYYMLEAAATLYCKPQITTTAKKWFINGRTILEVEVPRGDLRPYFAMDASGRWRAFIRVKDQNIMVNSIQIQVWNNEKKGKGIFLEYTEKEKVLLNYLKENSEISLPYYCRIADISYRKASGILARLVSIKVVEIIYSGKRTMYRLKNQN